MEIPAYAVGDRVLVRPDESWLQPTRRLAAEGRVATVVNIDVASVMRGAIKVRFDVKRTGAKPHELFASPRELSMYKTPRPMTGILPTLSPSELDEGLKGFKGDDTLGDGEKVK